MPTKNKPQLSRKVVAKARHVLEFAERRAGDAADWMELSNTLFGPGGKATLAFPTEAERTAFCRSATVTGISSVKDVPFTVRVTAGRTGATLILEISRLIFLEIMVEALRSASSTPSSS